MEARGYFKTDVCSPLFFDQHFSCLHFKPGAQVPYISQTPPHLSPSSFAHTLQHPHTSLTIAPTTAMIMLLLFSWELSTCQRVAFKNYYFPKMIIFNLSLSTSHHKSSLPFYWPLPVCQTPYRVLTLKSFNFPCVFRLISVKMSCPWDTFILDLRIMWSLPFTIVFLRCHTYLIT